MLTPRNLVKKALPPRARVFIRNAVDRGKAAVDRVLELAGRKGLRTWRSVRFRPRQGLDIAMLCIRKPVYVDMALSSINSLHYRNPACRVLLHLDGDCFESYTAKAKGLDYPDRVHPVLVNDDKAAPWQFTKLDVVLAVSAQGIPFVDADSRWHRDPEPLIRHDHAMFLVKVNRIREIGLERLLVEEGLGRPAWVDFIHFNTGFISIPKDLYSEDFSNGCRSLCRKIHEATRDGRFDERQRQLLNHTSEELSLSLVSQDVIGGAYISTLKEVDGPGNRDRLESYYYGAIHGQG